MIFLHAQSQPLLKSTKTILERACVRVCVSVILTGQFLSCMWANLAETLVDGRDRSWLPCHQVAPRSATRGRHLSVKGAFSQLSVGRFG